MMRRQLVAGGALTAAAVLLVLVSDLLDLRVEGTVLLGAPLGAVLALVRGEGMGTRLAGFWLGIVAAWLGYLLRAGVLPDSSGGRVVAVAVVLALCVAVVAVSVGHLPLWSALLGVAAMVGAYEDSYSAAPPEVLSTSPSAATAVLVTSAVGFFVATLLAPRPAAKERREHRDAPFDEMMEAGR